MTSSAAFFYLAFVVTDEPRLAVAFPRTLPPLHVLQGVYRDATVTFNL